MTVFLRLLAEDDKPQALLGAVREAGRRSAVLGGNAINLSLMRGLPAARRAVKMEPSRCLAEP
jgi:hypothetical protein